jgi:hypothetical protein
MTDTPNLDEVILELWELRAEMARAAYAEREVFISDLRRAMRQKRVTRRSPMREFTQREIEIAWKALDNAQARTRDQNGRG